MIYLNQIITHNNQKYLYIKINLYFKKIYIEKYLYFNREIHQAYLQEQIFDLFSFFYY